MPTPQHREPRSPNPLTCPPIPRKTPPKPCPGPPIQPHDPPNSLLELAEMRGNEREIGFSILLPRNCEVDTREWPGRSRLQNKRCRRLDYIPSDDNRRSPRSLKVRESSPSLRNSQIKISCPSRWTCLPMADPVYPCEFAVRYCQFQSRRCRLIRRDCPDHITQRPISNPPPGPATTVPMPTSQHREPRSPKPAHLTANTTEIAAKTLPSAPIQPHDPPSVISNFKMSQNL